MMAGVVAAAGEKKTLYVPAARPAIGYRPLSMSPWNTDESTGARFSRRPDTGMPTSPLSRPYSRLSPDRAAESQDRADPARDASGQDSRSGE